jgi:hypothetical protein
MSGVLGDRMKRYLATKVLRLLGQLAPAMARMDDRGVH